MRNMLIAAVTALAGISAGQAAVPAPIAAAVANPARPAAERARDLYRHPAETLAFFGVAPGQTVGEYLPSGGWYTHILMPLLAGHGHYVAVVGTSAKSQDAARTLIASQPGAAQASVTAFDPKAATLAPAGSLDRLLTFRNIHNLMMAEDGGSDATAAAFFQAAFKALKPGGVLGVVDHRLPADRPEAQERTSGYVKVATVIRLASAAGFKLAGQSEINANPKDSADWPKGVWTLPPTYTLSDTDRAKYQAIGESDRMTLKFVKPR
ncbi:class I SAM-dependent methyltransferase [Sphingomonas nostoxanthinifaciens]|uniref:class I SAM-dependent methyltransferase n=1 Tax=Sphingomonas nostoxanthinifaciens TaxID=2872652 RepID=UPI001CC1F980|nr:methyltransferase [Sphingomonas nostoxanthinifaciens]UAK25416.1 methyltransferase [Sphingomonas nostoxanthinifaciens]